MQQSARPSNQAHSGPSSSAQRAAQRIVPGQQGTTAQPGQTQSSAQAVGLPEASQEALQQLVAMGFDSAEATRALRLSNNDVQTAIAMLL